MVNKNKKNPTKNSLPPLTSKKNNNNASKDNSVSDEQLAKDLFTTPKPKVVVEPPKTTVIKASEIKKPETVGNTSSADKAKSSSSHFTQRTNLIDPDEYVYHEDIEKSMDYEELEKDYIVVAKPSPYALATSIPLEPKKHPKEILKMVNEAFLGKDGFQGANYRRVNLIKTVIVYFDNSTDIEDATDCIIKKGDYALPL